MCKKLLWALIAALAVGATTGCKGHGQARAQNTGEAGANSDDGAAPVPFVVSAQSTGMVFTWFDTHGAGHTVSRVEDVPRERRASVRVDPPRPEQRAAGWVYLANLSAIGPSGAYSVRAVRSEQLAAELSALTGVSEQGSPEEHLPSALQPSRSRPPNGAVAHSGASQVIIYGASWCGVCHQAAAYLRSRHVAFVEKDIERDPEAQAEMVQKARRAGIAVGSIPILDVRGTVMQGFSPPAIDRALAGG